LAVRRFSGAGQLPTLRAPTFVGRERELSAFRDALSGPPFVVLVEGEAGIGKSQLLREFRELVHAKCGRSLMGVCPPLREPFTLGPVVDAIREARDQLSGPRLSGLAGALRALFPEWSADLPPAPEPLPDATAARHRLFRSLVELIGWLEINVLMLDDVHWADEATIEFLLFLLSRPQPPVNIVASFRPEEVPDDGLLLRLLSRLPTFGRRFTLSPLGVEQTAAFASSMLAGEPISARFASFLQRSTEGLPLALEESIRLMHDRADLVCRNGEWVRRRLDHIDVPPTIRDAVLERVARLDSDTRAVVNAAAVLGDAADQATVADVAGLAPQRFAAGLAGALTCGVLWEDSRGLISFRHELVCRAVYEQLPAPERRHRHLLAGRSLESAIPLPAIQLVRHFRESAQRDDCCRYVERAVAMCRESGDENTASHLLHRLLTSFAVPVDALVRFAGMLSATARPEVFADVIRLLDAALREESLTAGMRAAVRFQLGRLLMVTSSFDAARQQMELAIPDLPVDSFQAVRGRYFLAIPLGDVRPAAEHLRWLRETRIPASLTPTEQLQIRADRILALVLLGQESAAWEEARRLPERTDSPTQANISATARKNLAESTMHWGRYADARRLIAQAFEVVADHELPRCHAMISVMQARLNWLTGNWSGLEERLRELAEEEFLLPDGRGEVALVAGLLQSALGDDESAERLLMAARRDGEQRNATDRLAETAAGLAALRLSTGDLDGALRLTEEPADITVHKGIWMWGALIVPIRAHTLIESCQTAKAAELVDAFERVLGGVTAPAPRAALVGCRALLAEEYGDPVRAANLYGHAAHGYDGLPQPYTAALVRERQAACLIAADRVAEGLSVLADVLDEYSILGVRHRAGLVRETLQAHGHQDKSARRPGRPGYGDKLSPREREVVRLLMDGRTNQQIAATLVISRQTVVSHLQSAMRKLRVSSRTALAVKAAEMQLVSDDDS
jgi:DNA-binding CsgD family transcriptional regulator/tetratricopeptide (TPR) repeat protein